MKERRYFSCSADGWKAQIAECPDGTFCLTTYDSGKFDAMVRQDVFRTYDDARLSLAGWMCEISQEEFLCLFQAPVTLSFCIYGRDGHRQRESFHPSFTQRIPERNVKLCVFNSDLTGTNEFTKVRISALSREDCERELWGQITDGIFENSRIGMVCEVWDN